MALPVCLIKKEGNFQLKSEVQVIKQISNDEWSNIQQNNNNNNKNQSLFHGKVGH